MIFVPSVLDSGGFGLRILVVMAWSILASKTVTDVTAKVIIKRFHL